MEKIYKYDEIGFMKCVRAHKHYLFLLILSIPYFLNSNAIAAQTPLMRDVFAAMPDSFLPMVSKNNRLDCIDFIENNMEAKVRNVADEYVTLEALTKDYARFRTSPAAVMEMKLLPLDSAFVLCIVTTAQTGEPDTPRRLEDSNIRFRYADWSPLPDTISWQSFITVPYVAAFFTQETDESHAASTVFDNDAFQQALCSLADFHPVRFALSPDTPTLTATLQPAYLALEERKAIMPHLHSLTFQWNGSAFVASKSE